MRVEVAGSKFLQAYFNVELRRLKGLRDWPVRLEPGHIETLCIGGSLSTVTSISAMVVLRLSTNVIEESIPYGCHGPNCRTYSRAVSAVDFAYALGFFNRSGVRLNILRS